MVSVCLPSDALLQHLPSYLGFSYLGRGVSLHGCSSKAQLLLLTLDEGNLLTDAPPDLECGVAPLGPPAHTWTSPDGQHRNQTDYILCSQRWRSSIQLAKTRPGDDCGSDHELLIAKFRKALVLCKEDKWKGKKKKKGKIWMQSSKEQQEEIRKPSSVINARK